MIHIIKISLRKFKSLVGLILNKSIRLLKSFYIHLSRDKHLKNVDRWFKDKGDETLRLNYPNLNKDSVVFDLGGYIGEFAEKIHDKYNCNVYIFEPHPKFYEVCKEKFIKNPKIKVFNYGISYKDENLMLYDEKDGSSIFSSSLISSTQKSKTIKTKFIDYLKIVKKLDINKIDLMKINIEGGEYPLLEHIIKNKKLNFVDNYQIQFHNFIDKAVEKREYIIQHLKKTHNRNWNYEFVWENWEKK